MELLAIRNAQALFGLRHRAVFADNREKGFDSLHLLAHGAYVHHVDVGGTYLVPDENHELGDGGIVVIRAVIGYFLIEEVADDLVDDKALEAVGGCGRTLRRVQLVTDTLCSIIHVLQYVVNRYHYNLLKFLTIISLSSVNTSCFRTVCT